jgi:hypothetical protein
MKSSAAKCEFFATPTPLKYRRPLWKTPLLVAAFGALGNPFGRVCAVIDDSPPHQVHFPKLERAPAVAH